MKDFFNLSPLRVLDRTPNKVLGKGNIGVLMARAGAGKTSCLINIAFDSLFRGERIVHISLKDNPDKIKAHYNLMLDEIIGLLGNQDEPGLRELLNKNRIIFTYLKGSFNLARLREGLENLREGMDFTPGSLIVDGMDFETAKRSIFEGFKDIAREFHLEVWFSALSHRHITEANERGIPFPCDRIDDLFTIILQIYSTHSSVFLKVLKGQEEKASTEASLNLNPDTFLASKE